MKTQTEKASALVLMATRLSVEPQKLLQTLKETVFKGATESELLALVVVANEYGLSPLLKEIYAFPNRTGGIIPVVSIDGWISITNRQPNFDGLSFSFEHDSEGKLFSCTCNIYLKDRTHPVAVTEFYFECYRATEPWRQMPHRMLRHKALKEAARIAFGFSGITDEDEAHDISRSSNIKPVLKGNHIVAKPNFSASPSEESKEKPEGGDDEFKADDIIATGDAEKTSDKPAKTLWELEDGAF